MNQYEAMIVVDSKLPQNELTAAEEFLRATISKEGSVLDDFALWNKRKLAYIMQKKKEGIYYIAHFKAIPSNISKIERAFKLDERVLKTLILKQRISRK